MDRESLYDIIYALAARSGRESALFGKCAPAAREAFAKALTGSAFPEIWFELPLADDPWFDLHVLVSHSDIAGSDVSFAGHDASYNNVLRWFANRAEGVRQLALSYDVSSGAIDSPAIQLLANRKGTDVVCEFLEAAGQGQKGSNFQRFCTRIPNSWYACYTGVFPGRSKATEPPFLRVECIVGDEAQSAYAHDRSVLGEHLTSLGASWAHDDLLAICQELASSPFPLEFQFNVGPEGDVQTTLGASIRFQPEDWKRPDARNAMQRLMERACAWGVADDRWRILADTIFAKRVKHGDVAVTAYCFPAFLKLRWRDGALLDAKAYLLARADPIA